MTFTRRTLAVTTLALAGAASALTVFPAFADNADAVEDARHTLAKLEATDERAAGLARHARGILVFPTILKAGFVFGGETGNGVLFEHGRPAGYYNLTGGSWGLQIGAQGFSFVLYFMTNGALEYLNSSAGFSAGTGPSITVINQGGAAHADITTMSQDVYAFPFNGKGLMADLTLQGTKITRIHD
jgi:lipid-binding SYLF domain-containing protein